MSLQDKFSRTLGDVLKSPSRTNLLMALSERNRRFAELQKISQLSSSNLNYHLLKGQAAGVIGRDADNKYKITVLGSRVTKALKQICEINEK